MIADPQEGVLAAAEGRFDCMVMSAHFADFDPLRSTLRGLISDDTIEALADAQGARWTHHPAFPNGVNVGFWAPDAEGWRGIVQERGAGRTLACGTGAAAAAAEIMRQRGGGSDRLALRLPGGPLEAEVDSVGDRARVALIGTAQYPGRRKCDLLKMRCNIDWGTYIMALWRRKCKGKHHWLRHYNWYGASGKYYLNVLWVRAAYKAAWDGKIEAYAAIRARSFPKNVETCLKRSDLCL